MPRCLAYALPFALVALAPAVALAAGDDCPDGWFCEPNGAPRPAGPNGPVPSPGARPSEPSTAPRPGMTPGSEPPGYPPPNYPGPERPSEEEEELNLEVPPDNPAPVRRRHRGFREWGFNLHLEAALMGNKPERASNAEMAGLGFGFRYRLIPALAFEAGVDLLTGTDFQGYSRSEAALLFNTLVFFNPHDVVQIYGLGGLGFSGANVTVAPRSAETSFKRHDENYSYFGGQVGFGVEVRVTRHIAIASDLIGFIRGRTDERSDDTPEFVDANTHRATNTSGGGLLRGGITYYW